MAGCVPSSFGSPLREFNRCHDATGKFCAGPRGLTGLRATTPTTLHGRMDPAHAMNYDVTRAQQLGISMDVFAGAGSSGSARSLRNTVRVGYSQDRATPVETPDDAYKPSRASNLSVLRHEIGHVTDRGFGMRGDPSEARILGRTYPAWYLMEIGAWKAAVRDAPHNRVQWPRVAKSLRSYLAELMPLPDAWQTANAQTALLKRYGQVLRRKALIPKETLDPKVGRVELTAAKDGATRNSSCQATPDCGSARCQCDPGTVSGGVHRRCPLPVVGLAPCAVSL